MLQSTTDLRHSRLRSRPSSKPMQSEHVYVPTVLHGHRLARRDRPESVPVRAKPRHDRATPARSRSKEGVHDDKTSKTRWAGGWVDRREIATTFLSDH